MLRTIASETPGAQRPAAAPTQGALITVDVEALPSRAPTDHVKRLVLGRFPGQPSLGLREMMAEAEKVGLRLTCFFDYCEVDLYGKAFLDIAREIADRGHELELHAHAELLRDATWSRLGLAKPSSTLGSFTEVEAGRLFDWLLEQHGHASSRAPIAFRGGGYRFGEGVLAAMKTRGLSVSSNHNPGRKSQFDPRMSCEVFSYPNGIVEIPISVLDRGGARAEFNFNSHGFEQMLEWFPQTFAAQYGTRSVLNVVLHSRSFLALDERQKHFVPAGTGPLDLYRELLLRVRASSGDVVGLAAWAGTAAEPTCEQMPGQVETTRRPNAEAAAIATGIAVEAAEKHVPLTPHKPARTAVCPVCGAPEATFTAFNGRDLARCAKCGALERQRSLVQAWNSVLKFEVSTDKRDALLVSPARSERMLFAKLGFASIKTLDIRPDAGCDLEADLCAMPDVADASFDLVFASHVLPHVKDAEAAYREIARILRADGVFIAHTPARLGQPTVVHTQDEASSGWYGREMFDRYGIGNFRQFGDLGLLRDLQRHFIVKTVWGNDPITKRRLMWTCAWKPAAADMMRSLPGARAVQL